MSYPATLYPYCGNFSVIGNPESTSNSASLDEGNNLKIPGLFTIIKNSNLNDLIITKAFHFIGSKKESILLGSLINSNFVSNHRIYTGTTLKSALHLLRYKMSDTTMSAYDKALIDTQFLMQVTRVDIPTVTLDGTEVLGGLPEVLFTVLSEGCENFFRQNASIFCPEEQRQMIDALRAAGDKPQALISAKELVSSIQSGKMTFIGTGWEAHTICLGFYNGHMMIGNTGQGPESSPSLVICDIDPNKMTEKLIKCIQDISFAKYEFAYPFFYEDLPKILRPNKLVEIEGYEDERRGMEILEKIIQAELDSLISSLLPHAEEFDSCTFEAARAALVFAAISLKKPSTQAKLQMLIDLGPFGNKSLDDIQKEVFAIYHPIFVEIEAIRVSLALDHLVTYCNHYYSPETGLPIHVAAPKEVIQACWKTLRMKIFVDYRDHPVIRERVRQLFETHPHLGLEKLPLDELYQLSSEQLRMLDPL
jgi:hypothetical protein